jgi:hypothetical protein
VGKRWTLGRLKGKECNGEVKLSVESGVTLSVANQTVPLINILTLDRRGLIANNERRLGVRSPRAPAPSDRPMCGSP